MRFTDDLRSGWRGLRQAPGANAVAIISLALAIGAVSAIFSVVYGAVLAPLPYRDPGRLVAVETRNPFVSLIGGMSSGADFTAWQKRSDAFAAMGVWSENDAKLGGLGPARHVEIGAVSAGLPATLGARIAIGRGFEAADFTQGGPREALLTATFWKQRFAGSKVALGKTLVLDGKPYTIVGVLPERFVLPGDEPLAAWIPQWLDPAGTGWEWHAIARLKPGVTIAHASSEVAAIESTVSHARPALFRNITAYAEPLAKEAQGRHRAVLLLLLGAVGFLLLIACANVANILLVRASARGREMAIRAALGASRGRLARQWFAESLTLGLVAAGGGLLVAWWSVAGLTGLLADEIPTIAVVGMNPWVLCFTLAVAIAASLLFGLAPAAQLGRAPLRDALQAGTPSATGERGANRLRRALAATEIALALLLAIGGGLLFRSLWSLETRSLGFDASHLLAVKVDMPDGYATAASKADYFGRALARMRRLPGVEAAAVSDIVAYQDEAKSTIRIPGRPRPAGIGPIGDSANVGADYFRVLQIPLLAGRYFTAADSAPGAPKVAIIDTTMAREYWPHENPLGQKFNARTIVGVVGHVLGGFELTKDPGAEFYYPEGSGKAILLRTAGAPQALVPSVRRALGGVDPAVAIDEALGEPQIIQLRLTDRRAQALLLWLFAGLALLLAALGVYGVISYSVARRTRELGLRAALGAARGALVRLVIGEGLKLAAAGIVIGWLAAAALTRLLGSWLYGVAPLDPATFAAAGLALALVALAACWLPARRAAGVDPMAALRQD